LTDFFGFLLIIPPTRRILISSISSKFKKKDNIKNENIIEGNVEENDEDK